MVKHNWGIYAQWSLRCKMCKMDKYNDLNWNFHNKKAVEINVFKADTLKWHILVTEYNSEGFMYEFSMIWNNG